MGLGLKDMSPEQRIAFGQALRAKPKEELRDFLHNTLTAEERAELLYDSCVWLRPNQYVPIDEDRPITLLLAGRGFGKTFTISRYIKRAVEELGARRIGIAAPTLSAIRDVIWNGKSGIREAYGPHEKNIPEYISSQSLIRWPNGCVALLVPAESPEKNRGPEFDYLIGDEVGSWKDGLEFFTNISMATRLAPSQIVLATTPRSTPLMIDLWNRRDADVKIITGSTFENKDNLSKQMIRQAEELAKTAYGQQEVMGVLQLTNPSAIYTPDDIRLAKCRKVDYPVEDWERVCIGVDPAGSNKKGSDLTGIMIGVLTKQGKVVIVEDISGNYSSDQWAKKICEAWRHYEQFAPVKVVVERTGAGAWVSDLLKREDRHIPVFDFPSTTKKYDRALSVSYQVQVGNVKLTSENSLVELETEMMVWERDSRNSPDRLDAFNFVVNELLHRKQNVTRSTEFIL